MDLLLKRKIISYISQKDPKKDLIKEITPNNDYSGGLISYNKDNLILHREISTLTNEEYVRAFLVVRLAKELRYPPSCIELEKEYEAGRPKRMKVRIDILVKDENKDTATTFLFIETKDPSKFENDKALIEGQLFGAAALEVQQSSIEYLVYYALRGRGNTIEDQAIIIDHELYPNFQAWTDAGRISLDDLPVEYGIARKLRYVNKQDDELESGEKNLDRQVTRERFLAMRDNLHNVLWGGGAMNYNDIFSNLVKLFLAKIFDEDVTRTGDPYTFQIELRAGEPESSVDVYEKVNALFKQAQKAYLGYSDSVIMSSVGIDREKISENKVAYVVQELEGVSLRENENKDKGDLLGEFFEGIVSKGFKQDKGQYFTHPNIVKFIMYVLDLDKLAVDLVNGKENPINPRLPFICDPACGSGTFLIEAMKFITKSIKENNNIKGAKKTLEFIASNTPSLTPNIWAKEYIYGIEINADLALATKVNMVLHGDGSANIFAKDGLLPFSHYSIPNKISMLQRSEKTPNSKYKKEVNASFDVIMSNPPFSVDLDTGTKRLLPNSFLYADKQNSENLFIERWYQLLKEGGRMGVVLPESVFDTAQNRYIRLFLYKYFIIKAIVSLPYLTFQPFNSTKTSLLFAEKKTRSDVEAYEKEWLKYSNEYRRLKGKIERYQEGDVGDLDEARANFRRYLKHYVEEIDIELSISELLSKYKDEVEEVNKNWVWWVFSEVSEIFNYEIVMAEAENIGYKRTKRGERSPPPPNNLYEQDESGQVSIDTVSPKTILDHLKAQKLWS